MSASDEDIARLRRMTNEPTQSPYSDALMAAYLEAWPLTDSNGLNPDTGGSSWTEAYDLHAAAADIWEEKAATFQAIRAISEEHAGKFDQLEVIVRNF